MASRMCVAVVLVLAMFVAGASAQMDCSMAMSSLTPCLTYVTGPDPKPSEVCCNGISNVNAMSPACLCQVIAQLDNNPSVNATKAYALPRDCNVQVDTSQCPAFSAPPMPSSMPPGLSFPPGLSAPPLPAAPPTDFSIPPGMSIPPGLSAPVPSGVPPIAAPPMFTPPSAPTTPPSSAPTSTPPTPAVSGPGASPPGASPGPGPASAGASAISASMVFAAALTGVVVAFVL